MNKIKWSDFHLRCVCVCQSKAKYSECFIDLECFAKCLLFQCVQYCCLQSVSVFNFFSSVFLTSKFSKHEVILECLSYCSSTLRSNVISLVHVFFYSACSSVDWEVLGLMSSTTINNHHLCWFHWGHVPNIMCRRFSYQWKYFALFFKCIQLEYELHKATHCLYLI